MLLFAFMAAVGAYGWVGLYQVEPDEQAVVLRLGRYWVTQGPGLQWHAKWIDRLEIRPVTVTFREEFGYTTSEPGVEYQDDPEQQRRMITGDTNLVNVQFVVQYRISNLKDYLLNVAASEVVIRDTAEAAIRAVIGGEPIDGVLTGLKAKIASDTQRQIQMILDEYGAGIDVRSVQLQDVQPPDPVKEAFAEVTSAEQDRERMVLEAQGYADKILPEARGAAAQVLNQAHAYKEARILRAQGQADSFNAVLTEYKKAKDVTRMRLYMETLEEILPRMDKVILEEGQGGNVLPYLPLGRRGARE